MSGKRKMKYKEHSLDRKVVYTFLAKRAPYFFSLLPKVPHKRIEQTKREKKQGKEGENYNQERPREMGNTCGDNAQGGVTPEQRDRDRRIDQTLKRDRRLFSEEIKLLLLGPGESGKSTIFKQMKLLEESSNSGFSDEQRKTWEQIVYFNIVSQMKVLIEAARDLNISLPEELHQDALRISSVAIQSGITWNNGSSFFLFFFLF